LKSKLTRRRMISGSMMLGVGLSAGWSRLAFAEDSLPLLTKAIPSSGEKLPVVGVGAYRFKKRKQMAERRDVVRRLPEIGGAVIDTAHAYGNSEETIGEFTAAIGNRDKLFIATKLTAPDGDVAQGEAMFTESLRRLQTDHIELLQVHNMTGAEAMLPKLLEWKQAGKVRYIGITTSKVSEHPQMLELMRKHPFDFVQVDYSLGNRDAAYAILPLALERKIGVLVNLPFDGRKRDKNLIAQVGKHPLPEWAAEVDASSWAQWFLKYIVSHPAVTCAIPGTTSVKHLEDNTRAARGRLPDAAMRQRMEEYWDSKAWA
jgi:aryl-alcohol dehydrogenase-like predicted oxidoreductase